MKIAVVLGTRPEIIKMSPLLRELKARKHDHVVIHTDQHFSTNMDEIFWSELELDRPTHRLGVRANGHAAQTGEMLQRLGETLAETRPDWVLVHGDTNSTLAGALAAAKVHGIKIAHVEAGLRSFDRSMPEEINRVLVDHMSQLLFAPTEEAVENLLREGISEDRIRLVGNTIEDAVMTHLPMALERRTSFATNERRFAIMTLHRAENTNDTQRFARILRSVFASTAQANLDVVFPVHPRTKALISVMEIEVPQHVKLVEPLGYFEFLNLMSRASLVITDSGGLQEEACLLSKPCVTLRENTERPETLKLGCNVLAGSDADSIRGAILTMLAKRGPWQSPYGGGRASSLILNAIEEISAPVLADVDGANEDVAVFGVEADASPTALERGRLR